MWGWGVAWDENDRGMGGGGRWGGGGGGGGGGGVGLAERKGAGEEAMRRKSTAHQGEIEMMEGSQLRRRDRRMETQ